MPRIKVAAAKPAISPTTPPPTAITQSVLVKSFSTSFSRIAEYVYGGAFLESVGVGAQYTNPEFTGIVTASKVYDNVDKVF